ncbi:MAG: AraC family transcriptional regulator [Lachnospiraceae bacterium]|nr:AraC family transcriptional regulator [Lachnospiraceae bacterium]MCI8871879.1 AraC family transcriptional regulator [Lachnospiraceae bacterium]GFI31049.1 arabinose operon regulatory protein [Lachnospiraceae bacterium]
MKKDLQTVFSPRQYMQSRDFEIYYYSGGHSYHVENHAHKHYEFYFFLEGNVSIQIQGREHLLKSGDMIVIPPGVPHFATVLSPEPSYRRFVFWISQEYCSGLLQVSPVYTYLMQQALVTQNYIFHYDMLAFKALQGKIFQLLEEIHSERFGKEAKISLCVNDLILHLNRSVYELQHPKTPHEELTLYQNLLQFIEGHLEEELSLNRLSQEFYVSKYHISHVFKENLGLSVHQFITKKRLLLCRDAILAHTAIGEACMMCGFQDYSSFFRAFKKEFGMSPKEYREIFMREDLEHGQRRES